MTKDLVPVVEPRAEKISPNEDPASPKIGRWYWVNRKENRWMGCVTEVGSNYAELKGVGNWETRIHFDNFWEECELIEDPDAIIRQEVETHQTRVRELMFQVKDVTARLAITTNPLLHSGSSEAQALVLRTDLPMDSYKAALVLAKDKTLPELFKEIREENDSLRTWMSASLIPMLAEAEALKPAIGAIKDRIFSVELYAGLVEKVAQVREGAPAGQTEKVHLIQRRAYMDEECLARYQTGGMEFRDIQDFDKWLARAQNFKRILPFPRSIIGFRVRRNAKIRDLINFLDLHGIADDERADKTTFLYIRNGEQLFRLTTEIEFGDKLFPDIEKQRLDGKLYARRFANSIEGLISENEYLGMVEEEEQKRREAEKFPEEDRWHRIDRWPASRNYIPFTPDNVYYDDIAKYIKEKMDEHNRLVLVLQGLLDRSPVLQPHPPWQLWTTEGFTQALELVYDDSRALVAGDKPDFEAYRARLNASLKEGSVTVGQEDAWERIEADKERRRRSLDYRHRGEYFQREKFRPRGNPGPGRLAQVAGARGKKWVFEWARKRSINSWDEDAKSDIRCTLALPSSCLLNVDAYKPGDFRQFFDDPRTRADYLEWAPLLLEAEEYHAGNRKVTESIKAPKRKPTAEGKARYQLRKERKAYVGKAVRLTREITTKGGDVYKKGSLWRVTHNYGAHFTIEGINPDGQPSNDERLVRNVEVWSFKVDWDTPTAKEAST